MRLDYDELEKYPEVLNKEQLRIVGHMSKRTALFLLENNLIPSTSTGKKTRCYKILKKDVIAFFEDQDISTDKYLSPQKWYNTVVTVRKLPKERYKPGKLKAYYDKKLKVYQDVMSVKDIIDLTGYSKSAVNNWISLGKLKAFHINNRFLVPKPYLLEWLLSEEYNTIERKSKKHLTALWA